MGMKLITIPLIVGILIIPFINSSGSVKGVTQEDNFVNLTKDDKIFPINHRVAVSESNVFVVWADITSQPQIILTTIIKTFSLPKAQMMGIVLIKLLI